MATTATTRAGSGKPVKSNVDGLNVVSVSHTITANPTAADVLQMVPVPKGARIVDVVLTSTDIDTNATPTITMKVGDTDSTDDDDRYVKSSTVGQAATGNVARLDNHVGHLYEFTEHNKTVDITFGVAAATFAEGTITLSVTYLTDAAA